MGEIRSALDIAMEKTAHIHGDKASAERRELKNKGKKAAGDYLASGDAEILQAALKDHDKKEGHSIREGAITNLLAALHLPAVSDDLAKAERIGAGLDALLPEAGMVNLFGQVGKIFEQYLAEREHIIKTLEQQFAPRLKAKQAELSRRYGQNVPMTLAQDPEYQNALAKNNKAIEAQYGAVIDEIRSRVRETAGITEE
jgi:hypothetical protein